MKKVEVQKVERLLDGFLSVDQATVRYERADGEMSPPAQRSCLERGDAVGVVLHERSSDRLHFVRQFRYACLRHDDPFPIEIVAGAIDEGESPADAAKREVEEEVGYVVHDLRPVLSFYSSPGITSEKLYVYYAEVEDKDRRHEGNLLEGEDLELVTLSTEEAFAMVEEGKIRDAKTVIGLLWLRQQTGSRG